MTTAEAARQRRPGSPPMSVPKRMLSTVRAVVVTARPRQWPKNLLVLAAPLAYGGWGPRPDAARALGLGVLAFIAASIAVYFVNDALDVERDREHPRKRLRPVAAGLLSPRAAVGVGVVAVVVAGVLAVPIGDGWFDVILASYLVTSFAYSLGLKHLAVVEILLVASGFVLRALAGAAAGHIPPSNWFVAVCGLGALVVVLAKRTNERAVLTETTAVHHRPALAHYRVRGLRTATIVATVAMLGCYLAWATAQHPTVTTLEIASVVPLAAAMVRFDRIATRPRPVRVEDLLLTDPVMIVCELCWLGIFVVATMLS